MWIGDQIDNKYLQSRTILVPTQHPELPEASGSQFACISEAHGFSLEMLSAVMKVRIMLTALPKVFKRKNSRWVIQARAKSRERGLYRLKYIWLTVPPPHNVAGFERQSRHRREVLLTYPSLHLTPMEVFDSPTTSQHYPALPFLKMQNRSMKQDFTFCPRMSIFHCEALKSQVLGVLGNAGTLLVPKCNDIQKATIQ